GDVACENMFGSGDLILAKILHGVVQMAFWVIWSWRNRVVNAPLDKVDKFKGEDVFPSIQRLSHMWISSRSTTKKRANWTCWTSIVQTLVLVCLLLGDLLML
ncbi:hypothetical protein Tco_0305898, partial [Tanacetum coccineum]